MARWMNTHVYVRPAEHSLNTIPPQQDPEASPLQQGAAGMANVLLFPSAPYPNSSWRKQGP